MKRRSWLYLSVALAIVVAASFAYAASRLHRAGAPASATSPSSTTSGGAASHAPPMPRLAHIFLILEENKGYSQIVGSSSAPYLNALIGRYALATNYHALFHPSLPDYIALTSGSNDGITWDAPSVGNQVDVTNIADRIEAGGRTWREYAESMPSEGLTVDSGEYATRHNPFVYYRDIVDNARRARAHIVPLTQLFTDLRSVSTTPDYAFITPNMWNDMHDGPIATGDRWLSRIVPRILGSPAFRTTRSLLVVTWDEDQGTADNHIATILAGNSVKAGYRSDRRYDHYALLRTIEASWHLAPLTANDANAPTMSEFFK